ncbi:aspartate kinase [Candidatus Gracilibacteria bacterium]|nr:aspartate kinase [Candidatus Gracilibacteria bacterium]
MKVLKFGGTSVGSSEMIKKTAQIVVNTKNNDNVVVIVSAMTKVTNTLIDLCEQIILGDQTKVSEIYYSLYIKHIDTILDINPDKNSIFYKKLENELINLNNIIKGLIILKEVSDQNKAKILYYGEILSSIIVSSAINSLGVKSNNYLSRDLIMCDGSYLISECDYDKSEKVINQWLSEKNLDNEIPVITGFGGGDENNDTYLFDRGGSDYVGSLVGRFLKAEAIEIWTDVDGIMSADPRIVEKPILWEELDYGVCAEFALVGAKVLHPKTISPAQEKFIPVYIKNTFNPDFKGTKICNKIDKGIKGINIDNEQILLNFVDPTMIGGYGYVYQVVKILNDAKISLDALATTETSFSISLKSKLFTKELKEKLINFNENFKVNIYENVTKISIVGDTIDNYYILGKLDEEIIMVTSGAYGKSLTIFIFNDNKSELLKKLHKNIFGQ